MPFISTLKYVWFMPWLLIASAQAADPSALWKIDSEKCVPHMRDSQDPAPCAIVDLAAGYVVLKDINGATQFLLMPTVRISGIESPAVLAPNAPNYWDLAWRARLLTEKLAGKPLPREALSLAVNSPYGRSQDQLHIHIDCVRRDVRDALAAHRDAIVEAWSAFPVPLSGQHWRAYRVDGENLGTVDPFRLLAKGDPDAGADMGKHTLAVVGMTWSDKVAGFRRAGRHGRSGDGNRGSGEDLTGSRLRAGALSCVRPGRHALIENGVLLSAAIAYYIRVGTWRPTWNRTIRVRSPSTAAAATLDLVDKIHPFHDLAPYRVLAIQMRRRCEHDEELTVGAVWIGGPRHAAGPAHEARRGEFRLQIRAARCTRQFPVPVGSPPLRHEAFDHPVEQACCRKISFPREQLDPLHMARREVGKQLDDHPSLFDVKPDRIFQVSRVRSVVRSHVRVPIVRDNNAGRRTPTGVDYFTSAATRM